MQPDALWLVLLNLRVIQGRICGVSSFARTITFITMRKLMVSSQEGKATKIKHRMGSRHDEQRVEGCRSDFRRSPFAFRFFLIFFICTYLQRLLHKVRRFEARRALNPFVTCGRRNYGVSRKARDEQLYCSGVNTLSDSRRVH